MTPWLGRLAHKRLGHRIWIALQGYGLIAVGAWTWVTYEIPALSVLLIVLGAGAHGWSRDLVFRALDAVGMQDPTNDP